MTKCEKSDRQGIASIVPGFETFQQLAQAANLVPVYKEIFADMETPVSIFSKFSKEASFLFENVDGNSGQWGRYSFIGLQPSVMIRGWENHLEIVEGNNPAVTVKVQVGDPLKLLEAELSGIAPASLPGLPDFTGGFVGYLSYDSVKWFEKITMTGKQGLNMPEVFFIRIDTLLIYDRLKKRVIIVENVNLGGNDLQKEYQRAIAKLDRIAKTLKMRPARIPEKTVAPSSPRIFKSSFGDKLSFMNAVTHAKNHIFCGDVVQVVLSQRFEREFNAEAFDIYRALRVVNPSPYMFYLDTGEGRIIGASPEILVQVNQGEIHLKPIAGTRRRGKTESDDQQMETELINDAKEIAEHMMLVDLGRNDVGRVAESGSVEVSKLMTVERYSHVMHMVSTVKGKLKPDKTPFDVLRSCFPAGTVTGAPKIRAMEIIEKLEPVRRGPYAGAVGTIGFSGNIDFCITIRSLIQKDNKVYVQAGAGIVADSNPKFEYKETVNKAMGIFRSVEYAERSFNHVGND